MMITAQSSSPASLSGGQRFSQSVLWHRQRLFFDQEGVGAWNSGKVPHYATSNPFIAEAYSKVVLGFLRDYSQRQWSTVDSSQPIYIVELGTGSGRFSYHFIRQFFSSLSASTLGHLSVKYVMTDLAQENVAFWRSHPALQPFISQGLLDVARFDAESDHTLTLEYSGEVLSVGTVKNPVVAIANYFFDSLPQDLFHIRNGRLYETRITVPSINSSPTLADSMRPGNLDVAYTDVAIAKEIPDTDTDTDTDPYIDPYIDIDYYPIPAFNQILHDYQQHLQSTYILFPIVGLHCIETLRQLSGDRLLLLSADKGYSRLNQLDHRSPPKMSFHQGCFSLMVNYEAIAHYTRSQGGIALLPDALPRSLTIGAFLFGLSSQDYLETRHAYHATMQKASPDDFFSVKKIIEQHYDRLTLPQILAYLRLSHWDFRIFLGCFTALMEQVDTVSESLRQEVHHAIHQIWDTYYFIGEEKDVPFHLAMVLYKLGQYTESLDYLEYSLHFYGDDPGMFYNQAMCYRQLGQWQQAEVALNRALDLRADFDAARILKQQIGSQQLAQKSH